MPHCVLWEKSDWQFAMDTAQVAARFHEGDARQAGELRHREKILGTTADARRDLRIVYTGDTDDLAPVDVSILDEYRRRLNG